MNLEVRPVTAADGDVLLAWRNDAADVRFFGTPEPVTEEAHRAWLADRVAEHPPTVWIAEADGQPAGSARVDGDSGTVSVVVDPRFRGQGVGRRLLAHLDTAAGDLALVTLIARVHRDNEPSLRLFGAAGYSIIGEEDPFVVLAKTLP